MYTTVLNSVPLKSRRTHWGDPLLRTFEDGPKEVWRRVRGKGKRLWRNIRKRYFLERCSYRYMTEDTQEDHLVTWTSTKILGAFVEVRSFISFWWEGRVLLPPNMNHWTKVSYLVPFPFYNCNIISFDRCTMISFDRLRYYGVGSVLPSIIVTIAQLSYVGDYITLFPWSRDTIRKGYGYWGQISTLFVVCLGLTYGSVMSSEYVSSIFYSFPPPWQCLVSDSTVLVSYVTPWGLL